MNEYRHYCSIKLVRRLKLIDPSNCLDVVTALSGLVAAGGGLWAAYAASQSAKSAQAAIGLAAQAERRALRRQLTFTSSEVLSEARRVKELAQQLKLEHKVLLKSSGMSSSSSEALAVARIDNHASAAEQLTNEAQQLADKFNGMSGASEEDLAGALSRIESHLLKVRSERIALDQEVATVANAKNEILQARNQST